MLNNKKTNIALIGFMGTGKTTIGKLLAQKLNLTFVDTDELIEKKQNKKIADIFKEHGEPYFRNIETCIIKEISSLDFQAISCGGGVVLNNQNIEYLKSKSVIVCLTASYKEIYNRIKNNKTRPLLQNISIEKIQKILSSREQFYKNCDISINTDNITPEQIVTKILSQIVY